MERHAVSPPSLRRPAAILAVLSVVVLIGLGLRPAGMASEHPAASAPAASEAAASIARAAPTARGSASPAPSRALPVSPRQAPAAAPPIASAATGVPSFSHIYLIVLENHEYRSIVGSSHAPYINSLIRRYGLATNYHAVTHPSQPNYLALFAGSTFGIRDDGVHTLRARNLADQLAAHGRSWHVYAQDLPSACYLGAAARGGVDLVGAAGWYARKHEPAVSFTSVSRTPSRCARVTHLAGFKPTAASFELIVPNMTNDMHDGTIAQGDAFLRAFVPRITRSSAFASSLLLITWDEGSTRLGGGGHVATLVVSPRVKAGFRSATSHTHYSLLRTIEDAWGLGCLNHTCTANDMREFFTR